MEYCTDRLLLRLERDVAGQVFGTGWSGSATPSVLWENDTSDPIGDILNAKMNVVGTIGREPNVGVMGYQVYRELRDHPDLLDRIKYTQKGVITVDLLAGLFDLDKLLVGTAIYNSAAESATVSLSYIWGKHLWLGYVPDAAGLLIPASGYVFVWKDRKVERFREDQEHNDVFTASMNWATKITASDAGYLCKSVVT